MKKGFLGILIVFTILICHSPTAVKSNNIHIDYYWTENCSICEQAQDFLSELKRENPHVLVNSYNVNQNNNLNMLYEQMEQFEDRVYGVPAIFILDQYWIGFSAGIADELRSKIKLEKHNEESLFSFWKRINNMFLSLTLFTLSIAFLDGFNPCSIWVLTFLIGMLSYSKNLKKTVIVGFIFILTTAGIYGLFILGLVNTLNLFAYLPWMRNSVALAGLIIGFINVKDFFLFKKYISLSIPEKFKPYIYKTTKAIQKSQLSFSLYIITFAMALLVAVIELPCTAGFPIIWSNAISNYTLTISFFVFLLVLYVLVYLLIEISIVTVVVVKSRFFVLSEQGGKNLKLISGTLMVVVSLILLTKPDFLTNLHSLIIMVTTTLATGLFIKMYQGKIGFTAKKNFTVEGGQNICDRKSFEGN